MLKEIGVLNKFNDAIQKAVDIVTNRIIEYYGDVNAREEEISHQLSSEITFHLMDEIKKVLHNKRLKDLYFEVYPYKKISEETETGADLAGILEINYGKRKITKTYLAQAKVCKVRSNLNIRKRNTIYKNDKNILNQAEKMLNITSDSFFFLYSKRGIDVMPAFEVYLSGKNIVDTSKIYYLRFQQFYEKFFTCFIGDHKIAPSIKNVDELSSISKEFKVNNVLYIKIKIPTGESDA